MGGMGCQNPLNSFLLWKSYSINLRCVLSVCTSKYQALGAGGLPRGGDTAFQYLQRPL